MIPVSDSSGPSIYEVFKLFLMLFAVQLFIIWSRAKLDNYL